MNKKKAILVLADGTRFQGESFGYEHGATGEVVFNTAMAGYPESLTDPSYAGQIVAFTYPLIGNYGVPALNTEHRTQNTEHRTQNTEQGHYISNLESEKIQVSGLIVSQYSEEYSHWNAAETLQDWLVREQIPAITGIDTRRLTKHLREHGVMSGKIVFEESGTKSQESGQKNLVAEASCTEIIRYNEGAGKKVCLVDLGVQHSIIRGLVARGVEVIRVPWDYNFNTLDFDALFISNGPGDPRACEATIKHLRAFLTDKETRPVMAVGLGHQILSKVVGATIYKLPYGHRGHNQPVRMVGTNSCFITTQNHGYAVDTADLQADWVPSFVNMNDNSNEGIRHINKPWFSVQFEPSTGLTGEDTSFLYNDFIATLNTER